MTNEDDKTVKMEGRLDIYKGGLTINVLDVLGQLDNDEKQTLMMDGGWWNFIEREMAEQIVKEFSRENYNQEYTKLRGLILNSEAMPKVIREWAISLLESTERAKEAEAYWARGYWGLYRWIKDTYGYDLKTPDLPERNYAKEWSKELMQDVEKKIAEWKTLFPDKREV
jgi:hypothetical protein